MLLALLAAIVSAVGYGVATILQAYGARQSSGLSVIRQPWALAGLALDGVAWLASLVALNRLPLFVVQTIVGSSLIVVVLLAGPVLGTRPRRVDLVWVTAIVVALTTLACAAGEQPATAPPAGFVGQASVAAGVLVIAAVAAYRRGPTWLLAALASLGYGIAAVAARAADTSGGWVDILLQPLAAVLVVGGVVGVLCFLRAVERGPVGQAAAVLSVGEVVVPAAVGLAVLGDVIRPGWAIPAVVAGVVAVVGCLALASSPASVAAAE